MKKPIILKFRGNKDCQGKKIDGRIIGGMTMGIAYDTQGQRLGKYVRLVTDGGTTRDYQEVEILPDGR